MKVTGKGRKKNTHHTYGERRSEIDDAKRELSRLPPSMLILEIA